MYSNVRHDALGDLRCPGVDVDAWKKENRVPLFRGVNTWVMAYVGDPGGFDSAVRSGMSDWMSGSGGNADLITTVESYGETQPTTLAASAISKYPTDLNQPYLLSNETPVRYYKISFRWQSTNEAQVYVPWPVYNGHTFSSSGCITNATLGLFYVMKPQQLQSAEEVSKMTDELNKKFNAPAKVVADTSINLPPATATPWYLTWWALGGGALAVGSFIVLRGKKKR